MPTFNGTPGNDSLVGTADLDFIFGFAGDDTLSGLGNADFLRGDEGNDQALGGDGDDSLFAGPDDLGDDLFVGGDGDDTIGVSDGADIAIGDFHDGASLDLGSPSDAGANVLFLGGGDDLGIVGGYENPAADASYAGAVGGAFSGFVSGSDDGVIWAGNGDDVLYGGDGNDALGGGFGSDEIYAAGGDDTVYGGKGDGADVVDAGDGDDLVFTGEGADTLTGGAGNDELFNGGAGDEVDGGAGDDILWGGAGDDTLTGGTGSDTFKLVEGNGDDLVTDFDVTLDLLDFTEFATAPFSDAQDVVNAMTDVAGGVELTIAADQVVTFSGVTKADFDTATANIFNINGTPVPGPNPAGELLETEGANFNTINGFNILNGVTASDRDDTIEVGDPAHLAGAVLDGGGGSDSVIFDGDSDTFDLGDPLEIADVESLILGDGDDLRGEEAQLSVFDTITGGGAFSTFEPQGDVALTGPFTELSNFALLLFDGSPQTVALDYSELPSLIDFNDNPGLRQELQIQSLGGDVIDLSQNNVLIADLGAGGSNDFIDLPSGGTVRIDGSNTGNFRNEQDIFFEEGAGSALMQTNGDLDITSFAFVDPDFDLESVGTNREIIGDDAARSITGDGGDNAINAAGGADTIDGGGGSDTILGGSEVDTINLGAPGDSDVLSVADFDVDGKDRDVVTNFESGSAGDVYNIEAASGGSVTGTTLSGTDNFTTTNSIQTASSPGVTYLASTEVLLFEGADLAGDLSASPGANVLNGNGALAATGGIDVASDGDTVLFAIGDTAGNTAVYLIDERPDSVGSTVSVQEAEMTLIGVLEDVAVNSLIVDNFSNMDLF